MKTLLAACVFLTINVDFNNDGVDEYVEMESCYSGSIYEAGRVFVASTTMTDLELHGVTEEQQLGYDYDVVGKKFPVLIVYSYQHCPWYVHYDKRSRDLVAHNICL